MKLGNLVVEISADSTNFIKGTDKVQVRLGDISKRARNAVSSFAKYSAAAGIAGTAVTAALYTKAAQAIDAQAKLATQLNTTSASMATITRAGELSGIGMDKIATAGRTLTTRLAEVSSGAGPAAESFKRLGLNAEEVASLPLDQRINAINTAIRQNIPATEQAAVAADFFGERMGTAILTLSGDTISQARRETELFGLALSDVDAAKVEMANDAFSTFGMAADGIIQQLTVQLAPIVNAISKEFINAAEEAGGFGNVAFDAFEKVINAAAFVADAADGIKRTFQVVSDGILIAINEMLAAVANKVAGTLDIISMLPGVDFSETVKSLDSFAKTSEGIVDEAWNNIDSTLSEPFAGDSLRQFVDDARKAGEEAAQATVEARQAAAMPTDDGPVADPETEKLREQLSNRLQMIRDSNSTELELLRNKQAAELEDLRSAKEQQLLTEQEYHDLFMETKQRHEDDITEIEARAAEARMRQVEDEARAKQQIMSQALSGLTSLMNSENRKMFEIGKAASISQSIISTYTGMTKALELGWPLGPIAASAIAATGFAQVQSIRQQSFGGGGGSAGTATQSVNAASTPVNQPGGQQPPQQMIVSGIDEGELFSGGRVRSIVGELLEYQRNGGQVILA